MELLSEDEGRIATLLARGSLVHAVAGRKAADAELTPVFYEKRGVFVTLTKDGDLRGCIGFPYPYLPLADAIRQAAVAAALEDPRFPQVQAQELPEIGLEVTVLTVPQALTCAPAERPSAVEVGKHGLIVKGMGTSGLLLPQVATEFGWGREEFLAHTARKAGLPAGAWRDPDAKLYLFRAEVCHEERE
jgi:uncharacterized protein (TIGR00296 family)